MSQNTLSPSITIKTLSVGLAALGLMACSSDEESGTGSIKFYNASPNAPSVFMTIDDDLSSSETDDVEITVSGVSYGSVTGSVELDIGEYFLELAWQDSDSYDRDDLAIIYEDTVNAQTDSTTLVVLSEDIEAPRVFMYNIPFLSEEEQEDDTDNDLFNLRLLNMASESDIPNVDVYISKSNETFNEAQLLTTVGYSDLSENLKLDQDEYTIYLTETGETTVLFTSEELSYSSATQYLLSIRNNQGAGDSPFVLDWMANSSLVYQYNDKDAQSQFRVYNGIETNEQLPDYEANIDVSLSGLTETFDLANLAYGDMSPTFTAPNGDYSVDIVSTEHQTQLQTNHLLTLPENIKRTLFLYLEEVAVDDDNDGNVDEDGDGIVDETEVHIRSLQVTNSLRDSIYDHQITAVNLIDNADFTSITLYYVRSDEVIETAEYSQYTTFGNERSLTLLNNTYTVYAVAREGSSEVILATDTLTLDEESGELMVVLDENEAVASGYSMTFMQQ